MSSSTGSANNADFYAPVGNRLSSADVGDVIAHNERNELRVYGNLTFSYDAHGNQTDRRDNGAVVQRFIYDAENRLVRVEDGTGGLIARYEYDPFGRRVWKEVNGERTYFFYADEGLIAEFDENGKELRSYGYQPDSTWGTNPLWLKQNGQYYWYQNDHLGTPQTLVDATGTIVWQATYTAFGKASIQVETVESPLRFPGQYFDAETGLHYNFHRYYDPATGRYTQPDPIGFAGGDVNWYAYVGNNPISTIDPYGLWWLSDFLEGWLDNRARRAWGLPTTEISDRVFDGAVTEAQIVATAITVPAATFCDAYDVFSTGYQCLNGECSKWAVAGAATPVLSGPLAHTLGEALEGTPKILKEGKNYKSHWARARDYLQKITEQKIPKYNQGGDKTVLEGYQKLIDEGIFESAGMYTLKKGLPPVEVLRGSGYTLIREADGTFVTVLKSGTGMDSPGTLIPVE